jgi:SAM-dependent methyltransferase
VSARIAACRACGSRRLRPFVDLGETPSANAYRPPEDKDKPEIRAPLRTVLCEDCRLVQVDYDMPPSDLFSDYAYFSSYSTSWIEHARRFCLDARQRLGLGAASQVIEVASNDGYLLRHFVDLGVPVLGIEPAANVAEVAVSAGVPTEVRFFGVDTARDLAARGLAADLIVGNNVFAHVPDINDFVAGLGIALKDHGVISLEFPHLLRLIQEVQFDTIYHEHFSYFSLLAVERVMGRHGLALFDVEELPTHGGSLRVWVAKDGRAALPGGLAKVRGEEAAAGLDRNEIYDAFAARVARCRRALLDFLSQAKQERRTVVAYGAAAKGNTLLNSCGVTSADIPYVVDRNPHKQGRLLPGSQIPVADPSRIFETKPDYLLILPWNLKDEIMGQMAEIRGWGGRFVIPVPEAKVLP